MNEWLLVFRWCLGTENGFDLFKMMTGVYSRHMFIVGCENILIPALISKVRPRRDLGASSPSPNLVTHLAMGSCIETREKCTASTANALCYPLFKGAKKTYIMDGAVSVRADSGHHWKTKPRWI